MMRRNETARGRAPSALVVAAAVALVLTLSSGCLFPPVESDEVDDETGGRGGRDPGPVTTTPDGFVTRSGQQTRDGTLGPGARLGDDALGAESVDVAFALPPRVTSFTVTLDWSDGDITGTNQTGRLQDLDLSVVIQVLRESGAERVWGPSSDNGGSPGNPDAPVVIANDPLEAGITVDDNATLTATITPESSTGGVRWVCTLEYTHLVAPA